MVDESSTCSMTKIGRSTRGQKIRKKFDKHIVKIKPRTEITITCKYNQ